MNFDGYTVEELQPGLFAIDDKKGDSMYLVIGAQKALLIDTCAMKPDIRPMLRQITDKPIELALTHAHIDHMYHADEFSTVYLHEKDIYALERGPLRRLLSEGFAMMRVPRKNYNIGGFIPITENSVLETGNNDIRIISAPGHTPGSCIFADSEHKSLFVGDAIGNGGASAWMWLSGCSDISAYRTVLEELLIKLKPYENYQFLSGHRKNTLPTPKNPKGKPLNMQCIRDMDELCTKMLNRTIKPKVHIFSICVYAYKSTGMWTTKKKIK